MTTVKAVEDKLVMQQKKSDNTYLTPTKNMPGWYAGELLFVREVKIDCAVVFRALDNKLYSLNDEQLLNFKLL
tara:strand:+ start:295 stop:513 length:219 start_codon:yes stop_codon:yes gene_type:complete